MTVEFRCEGCGILVMAFGADMIPGHRLCVICRWCCENLSFEEIMDVRRHLEPGGWVTERERRKVKA